MDQPNADEPDGRGAVTPTDAGAVATAGRPKGGTLGRDPGEVDGPGAQAAPFAGRPAGPFDPAVGQAAAGDGAAFARLAEWCQGELWKLACHYAPDHDTARELCQESLLAAWQHVPRFLGNGEDFRAWLMTSHVRRCLDWRDRAAVEQKHTWLGRLGEPMTVEALTDLSDPAPPLEEAVENEELAQRLLAAVAAVPEPYRLTLLLYGCGYGYAEIAELSGVSVNTVASRLSRARRQAQVQLQIQGRVRPAPAGAAPSRPAGSRKDG
jgi:RNA polymerase sigma-70 factor (ECF subfamily)